MALFVRNGGSRHTGQAAPPQRNIQKVYAITKNITSSSEIEFKDSHKHVFVSRGYFKPLKSKLDEIRSKE